MRRMVGFSLIIIITNCLFVIYDLVIMPVQFPLTVHILGYAISNTVNVFCMVSIFGFSQKVLSLCCPEKLKYEVSYQVRVSTNTSE